MLIPNLLSYPGSCVVIDPKGENYRITAEHRRRAFGHEVVRLDPFGVCGGDGASFNPLDLLDPSSPHLIDDAKELANALIVRTGHEHEPHWDSSAEIWLQTLIAFVCWHCRDKPHQRHLQSVRDLITDPEARKVAIDLLRQSDACGGMLRQLGNQLTQFVDRELGSVLTTTNRHTAFLDSPPVAANTQRSSFDPRRLLTERMTVYLVLPAEKLDSHAALLRLWVDGLLRCLIRGGPQEKNPVLFFLDEAGNWGHNMRSLETAVTLLRGYGVRLWFFFQSIEQLRTVFEQKADVLLNNIGTQQFFGINNLPTAEMVSARIGDTTIPVVSVQEGQSYSYPLAPFGGGPHEHGQRSTSSSITVSETGRRLLKPEEILHLLDDQTVIFTKGVPPILGTLLRYYDAPEFRRGAAPRRRFRHRLAAGVTALGALLAGLLLAGFATKGLEARRRAPRPVFYPPAPYSPPGPALWGPAVPPGGPPGPFQPGMPPGPWAPSLPPIIGPQQAPFQRPGYFPIQPGGGAMPKGAPLLVFPERPFLPPPHQLQGLRGGLPVGLDHEVFVGRGRQSRHLPARPHVDKAFHADINPFLHPP